MGTCAPAAARYCADFFASLCEALAAPSSANNINLLMTWASYEGTAARWNPLATETPEPGSTCFNCPGYSVQNYVSEASGVAATMRTLENGYYPAILAALRANLTPNQWACNPKIIAEIHTWGTGGFATWIQKQGCKSTPAPSPPVASPPPTAPVPPTPAPVKSSGDTLLALAFIFGSVGAGAMVLHKNPHLRRRLDTDVKHAEAWVHKEFHRG